MLIKSIDSFYWLSPKWWHTFDLDMIIAPGVNGSVLCGSLLENGSYWSLWQGSLDWWLPASSRWSSYVGFRPFSIFMIQMTEPSALKGLQNGQCKVGKSPARGDNMPRQIRVLSIWQRKPREFLFITSQGSWERSRFVSSLCVILIEIGLVGVSRCR